MQSLLSKTTLVDDVCKYLRESITKIRIKPGEQLNEAKIVENLGISRSPLREAFRLLEGEGLIVRRSRKGVYVRKITEADVKELFPIRAALERLATELATPRLTEPELQKLKKIAEKMEILNQKGDARAYLKLNFDFHKQIVKGAQNKRLEEMIRNAGRQWMWIHFTTLYFKKSPKLAMASHKDIYIAMNDRDAKKAGECTHQHIIEGGERLLEFFPISN